MTEGLMKPMSPHQVALCVWTTVHGISSLLIAPKIPEYAMESMSESQLIELCVYLLCYGLLSGRQ